MNLILFCSILLLNLNFDQIFGFQCNFLDEFVNNVGYTCDLKLNNVGTHIGNKNDFDVRIVKINGNSVDDLFFNQSEVSICQRFKDLETIIIKNGFKWINENLIKDCDNLKEFSVNNTELQNIPINFFLDNHKLAWLSLNNNKFTTLQQNIFINLTNLKNLSLNKNQIKALPPKIFKSLNNLEMLWLDYNKLGTLNPNWFENLQNLELLNLGANGISELSRNIFKPLVNLQFLFLHTNKLTTIHWDSFPVNGRLNTIDLSHNKIFSIDEKFIDFTYVYWIDMMGNVCSQENIRKRNEVKDKLRKCLDNYHSF
ncbi:hypothetical protein ACKWTF_016694 [Chironomus riparius]